ncbi:E3 ubiquitin-protein ligase ubr1 [Zalaria obscura]|uniref:E3 ubiquitin-protein ligase ubr1 n=1 Tax=Zalaria obscura TaxID=2024903 RepID=A0ACC3SBS4_9PEZI
MADGAPQSKSAGKSSQGPALPQEVQEVIRMTISRVFDYICDVFSCAPEQQRLPKSEASVRNDEFLARLSSQRYEGLETPDAETEFALVLWNDEKHTVEDVQNQVARACRKTKKFGKDKAIEVNDVGRSIVAYSKDLPELLQMAKIIEELKVTVTVRSSKDTFREQMCATMVEWISDISGCSVGGDATILRDTICEEILKPWQKGSSGSNMDVGQAGIDDHEYEENVKQRREYMAFLRPFGPGNIVRLDLEIEEGDDEDDEGDGDIVLDDDDDGGEMEVDEEMAREVLANAMGLRADMEDAMNEAEDAGEAFEATIAGYPAPPPPPAGRRRSQQATISTPTDSDEGEAPNVQRTMPFADLPKTPKASSRALRNTRPPRYWLEAPEEFVSRKADSPAEDLWQRLRLDYLILYDLRLWKTLRIALRHLYISTVVTVPNFKRILGLRFAGLYTMLAQLYLIADREPDHSIINLSVQMLTTPSITAEVVERGNFLTNLLAILYTFLTTRQVGFPTSVNRNATLAFDAGAVTNRRMFHFFHDTRYMFQSAFVQEKVRHEARYLLQFLDLVKLHQGICPNVRAVGEHVEYEADAWISASMIIKEINRLCRQVAESFRIPSDEHYVEPLRRAIHHSAHAVLVNAFGLERQRFHAAEIKKDVTFHKSCGDYVVPSFRVLSEPMSFHHPLHYMLSWLIEAGRSLSRIEVRLLLNYRNMNIKDSLHNGPLQTEERHWNNNPWIFTNMIFDHPLRVCVWLAQMRAGMWVRNGITLRHQMLTYRGTSQRDVSYQRDILMLQAGLVLCGNDDEPAGASFLAQMIDRYDMQAFFSGDYSLPEGYEEDQRMDVMEDFVHMLVVLLSERGALLPAADNPEQHLSMLQRDIAHVLCFKPQSFSDISQRLTDRVADSEEFDEVLESMTSFRAPEGLNDSGTFELKPEFIEMIDPYFAYYSRNQREEADNIYRAYMAKKTGKPEADIVYEPQLPTITSGLFSGLALFTQTPLFVQVLCRSFVFSLSQLEGTGGIPATRVETFLQVVLHLVLLATLEDKSTVPEFKWSTPGFIALATTPPVHRAEAPNATLFSLLHKVLVTEQFAACSPKIRLIMKRMEERRPEEVQAAKQAIGASPARNETDSPAPLSAEDREKRKKAALERQAKVMAQFKQQQNSFMENQGIDWGEDLSEEDFDDAAEDQGQFRKIWQYPSGSCMLCQEETNDDRLYGTFAFISQSKIMRQTPLEDEDFVKEVLDTPESLDLSADSIRPFGVAAKNKFTVEKTLPDGSVNVQARQGLSKGFPRSCAKEGPVATSCGHIMHYSCFEAYLAATQRRHAHQVARNHPERAEQKEFLCPLCKALGNIFLPIIWKGKEETFPGALNPEIDFDSWLQLQAGHVASPGSEELLKRDTAFMTDNVIPSLATAVFEAARPSSPPSPSPPTVHRERSWHLGLPGFMGFRSEEPLPPAETVTSAQPMSPSKELLNAYHRIKESLLKNSIIGPQEDRSLTLASAPDQAHASALCDGLGVSISGIEIAQRGVQRDGPCLLSTISEQALTHLRILSETAATYMAVANLRDFGVNGGNISNMQTPTWQRFQQNLLMGLDDPLSEPSTWGQTLFEQDLFVVFNSLSFRTNDPHHLLRLCYTAEIVKVVFTLSNAKWSLPEEARDMAHSAPLAALITFVANQSPPRDTGEPTEKAEERHGAMLQLMKRYATTFLRKAIILMHARFGVDFSMSPAVDPSVPELDRLSQLLRLPSLIELLTQFSANTPAGEAIRSVATTWVRNAYLFNLSRPTGTLSASVSLPHPAIFELVGLPKNYDILTEAALHCRCPTTGKEVSDPAVCLFCGAIFCSQASCCMRDRNKGGCYQHLSSCGGNVGLFINIRKCMVLFMHGTHGSWAHAPYLDRHGEVDPTLRRHHQLFLNQRRYDKLLREVWLAHGVPSVISRRLEGDVNTGGWETL